MSDNIDPVATATEIKATYRRYLQSLLAVRDPQLDAALRLAIETTPMLDKGPYLEATPPYASGTTLRQLIADEVLHPGFAALDSPALPLDRPLYTHQERSIRKVRDGRNVVVATGTGSGKTESFLLPILDSLVREHARGELDDGVRALLLYPMNALANDQMKRLRQVLAAHPQITFGRYTGDTAQDPKTARDRFHDLNIGEQILPNELLSREEMRETPPHLLLTNYAMLEYLLLRPLDMDLFGSQDRDRWRFIVVDEAHVYDGTQGAEIGDAAAAAAGPGRSRPRGAVHRHLGHGRRRHRPIRGHEVRLPAVRRALRVGCHRPRAPRPHHRANASLRHRARSGGRYLRRSIVELAAADDRESAVLKAAKAAEFSSDDAATALMHEQSLVKLRRTLARFAGGIRRGCCGGLPWRDRRQAGTGCARGAGQRVHQQRRHHGPVGPLSPLPPGYRRARSPVCRPRAHTSTWPGTTPARTAPRPSSRSDRANAAVPFISSARCSSRPGRSG